MTGICTTELQKTSQTLPKPLNEAIIKQLLKSRSLLYTATKKEKNIIQNLFLAIVGYLNK